MYRIKFDKEYTRRSFMERTAKGVAATGVFMPIWDAVQKGGGDISAAYPEEALTIETYSKGAVKPGGQLDLSNVDSVKDLMDPAAYMQVKTQGRIIKIKETTTDISKLAPYDYLQATDRNRGKAAFDAVGNVRVKGTTEPWIGGNPFPNPANAPEIVAPLSLSWGRHDQLMFCIKQTQLDGHSNPNYHYEFCWVEVQGTGRIVLDPMPYMDREILRWNTAFFTSPTDVAGTSFLNIWPYDASQYPGMHGFIPAFKRIRRFPTTQRFDPMVPGSTAYLSDAWTMGDPWLTWGNYKVVRHGPCLGAVADNWNWKDTNWDRTPTSGPNGKKRFFDTTMELIPESFVVDCEPVKYPRSPYSRKRIWIDARSGCPLTMITYDRRGQMYKHWESASDYYDATDRGGPAIAEPTGRPMWSWVHVHCTDLQTNDIGLLSLSRTMEGGYQTKMNDPSLYGTYCTEQALLQLGA
jgi:hypothetical protein